MKPLPIEELKRQLDHNEKVKTNLLDRFQMLEMETREADGLEIEHDEIIRTIRLVAKNTFTIKLGEETYAQLKARVDRKAYETAL